MKNKILFISEGTILNPIIHSQGLPLLNSLSKCGFECLFISFERADDPAIDEAKKKYESIKYITIYLNRKKCFPAGIDLIIYGCLNVIKTIKEEKISLIHARSLLPACIGLIAKIFFPKILFLYDNRGVFIEEEIYKEHWKRRSIKTEMFKYLEKKILIKSNHIVIVSEAFRKFLIKQNQTIDQKMTVITNRTAICSAKIEKFKIENRRPNITAVYSGSAAAWQGVDELKRVFAEFVAVFPNGKFRILSYNSMEFEIKFKDIINDARLEIVSEKNENVFEKLLECHFGILIRKNNLINNVASPLKFAEYLSAGLPVMASAHIGDIKDVIASNDTGVLVDGDNYSKGLLEMKVKLQDPKIFSRCRKAAEEIFNLNETFSQYKNIYKNLLENGN